MLSITIQTGVAISKLGRHTATIYGKPNLIRKLGDVTIRGILAFVLFLLSFLAIFHVN